MEEDGMGINDAIREYEHEIWSLARTLPTVLWRSDMIDCGKLFMYASMPPKRSPMLTEAKA